MGKISWVEFWIILWYDAQTYVYANIQYSDAQPKLQILESRSNYWTAIIIIAWTARLDVYLRYTMRKVKVWSSQLPLSLIGFTENVSYAHAVF